MLRTLAARGLRLAPRLEVSAGGQASRGMSITIGPYKDREAAEEMLYFRKEEERMLQKMLAKVRAQAKAADPATAAAHEDAELAALDAVVGKRLKLSAEDKRALLEWKHTNF